MRCQSCGTEFSGNYGEACPACGTIAQNPFEQGAEAAGPSPWQSPRTAPGSMDGGPESPGDGIPWEAQQSAQSMFETIKAVLLDSQNAFARADKNVGIGPSFIYVLILGIAGGLINQLWGLATSGLIGNLAGMEGMEGLSALAGSSVAGFFLVPVAVVIGVFIWAGLVHVSLMIFGGANSGFESTFRAIAYAQGSTAVLQLVPFIGQLIAFIWSIVVEIMAIKELHTTTTGKSAGAVLLPIFVCCCAIIALVSFMGAFIGGLAGSGV